MKLTQAYAVGNELFRTHQEALAREREIALRKLMDGLDHFGFIKQFCSNEEFRKRVQEISDKEAITTESIRVLAGMMTRKGEPRK